MGRGGYHLMGKKSRIAESPAPELHRTSPLPPTTMSAQPHFEVQMGEIGPTPLPPQFDTTNLKLVFYGSLEYITLPEHNNNGEASIKRALCIHCVIKLISG